MDPAGQPVVGLSLKSVSARVWRRLEVTPSWVPSVLAACHYGFIWWLSSRPGRTGERPFFLAYLFNGGHAVLFGLLGLLICWALPRSVGQPGGRRLALQVIGLVALLGLTDELHQWGTTGRHASPFDLGTDLSGALFMVFFLRSVIHATPVDRRLCLLGFGGALIFPLLDSLHAIR